MNVEALQSSPHRWVRRYHFVATLCVVVDTTLRLLYDIRLGRVTTRHTSITRYVSEVINPWLWMTYGLVLGEHESTTELACQTSVKLATLWVDRSRRDD